MLRTMSRRARLLVLTLPVLLPALTACRASHASADQREVLATVQRFFDSLESGDAAVAASAVLPDAAFANVRTEGGERRIGHFVQREFEAKRAQDPRSLHEAFVGQPTVLIEGDVACVWTGYAFRRDGKPSHTGVDAFTLLRTQDGWRVAGGAYSVVPLER